MHRYDRVVALACAIAFPPLMRAALRPGKASRFTAVPQGYDMRASEAGADMTLEEIESAAWTELEGAEDPRLGFRYLSLCTVDNSGHPQARMVVLRRTHSALRLLEIHTDIRSRKWEEIHANPSVTLLGFCPQKRLQLRLSGTASLSPPGSEIADAAWNLLSPWTRSTYAGGPPGETAVVGQASKLDMESRDEDGKQVFGVLTFRASGLDWFKLHQAGNQRVLFDYDQEGALVSARRVHP